MRALRTRHTAGATLKLRLVGKLRPDIVQVAAAGAGAGGVATLRHEAFDHAVEHRAVIEALADQRLDLRDMHRRDLGEKLDRHAALLDVQIQRVLGV